MPQITVKIVWDWPDEDFWLNADSVALALHAYCPNTQFEVEEVKDDQTTTDVNVDDTPPAYAVV